MNATHTRKSLVKGERFIRYVWMAEMMNLASQPKCQYVTPQNYTNITAHTFVSMNRSLQSKSYQVSLLGLLAKIKV